MAARVPQAEEGTAALASRPGARRARRKSPFLENPVALAGLIIVGLFALLAVLGFWPVPYSTSAIFSPLLAPGPHHLLGTTDQGQDVLSDFIQGTRSSLLIGVTAGGSATAIGVIVGLASGYAGGWLDEVIQAVVNIFLVIPALPLMIVLAAYITFGGELPVVMVVALTGWAFSARILRAQMLGLRAAPFVEAARMAGLSTGRIVFGEIMPNMYSLIFSSFLFAVVYAILAAASLAFLGLGNLNIQSWGTMLYWAQNDGALPSGAWWWFIPPGLAIAVFGAALTMVNYGLDAVTNPRLRTVRAARRKGGARRERSL